MRAHARVLRLVNGSWTGRTTTDCPQPPHTHPRTTPPFLRGPSLGMTNALGFVVHLSSGNSTVAQFRQPGAARARRRVALSVTGTGQVSQRTSVLVLISIVAIVLSAMA